MLNVPMAPKTPFASFDIENVQVIEKVFLRKKLSTSLLGHCSAFDTWTYVTQLSVFRLFRSN